MSEQSICGYCDCRRPKNHGGMHWRPAYAVDRGEGTRPVPRPSDAIWTREDELVERLLALATAHRSLYQKDRRQDMVKELRRYLDT